MNPPRSGGAGTHTYARAGACSRRLRRRAREHWHGARAWWMASSVSNEFVGPGRHAAARSGQGGYRAGVALAWMLDMERWGCREDPCRVGGIRIAGTWLARWKGSCASRRSSTSAMRGCWPILLSSGTACAGGRWQGRDAGGPAGAWAGAMDPDACPAVFRADGGWYCALEEADNYAVRARCKGGPRRIEPSALLLKAGVVAMEHLSAYAGAG